MTTPSRSIASKTSSGSALRGEAGDRSAHAAERKRLGPARASARPFERLWPLSGRRLVLKPARSIRRQPVVDVTAHRIAPRSVPFVCRRARAGPRAPTDAAGSLHPRLGHAAHRRGRVVPETRSPLGPHVRDRRRAGTWRAGPRSPRSNCARAVATRSGAARLRVLDAAGHGPVPRRGGAPQRHRDAASQPISWNGRNPGCSTVAGTSSRPMRRARPRISA